MESRIEQRSSETLGKLGMTTFIPQSGVCSDESVSAGRKDCNSHGGRERYWPGHRKTVCVKRGDGAHR